MSVSCELSAGLVGCLLGWWVWIGLVVRLFFLMRLAAWDRVLTLACLGRMPSIDGPTRLDPIQSATDCLHLIFVFTHLLADERRLARGRPLLDDGEGAEAGLVAKLGLGGLGGWGVESQVD